MNGARGVRLVFIAAALAVLGVLLWTRRTANVETTGVVHSSDPAKTTASAVPVPTAVPQAPGDLDPAYGGESPLAEAINASNRTIQQDLQILSEVFDAWQTNFPRLGNPVGENADITAALAGANELKFAFIPKRHPAINSNGELCDRWGTPFRFHQLSGRQMEMRSAGPDRKFGTTDDAILTPGN
jgi:hypothetical protein